MALHSINSTTDVEATINALEASVNSVDSIVDSEETTYSTDIHPEGEFEAEIIEARQVKSFVIVDMITAEGEINKFFTVSERNGKPKIDPRIRYLLKAAGIPSNNFTLSSLVGKIVEITVKHNEKDGEDYANIVKIQ